MTKSDALDRVKVAEDPNQDEAATIFVDTTNGADIVHVTVNPNLIGADTIGSYQVKGAVASVLEGFKRYNRTMTGKYGTFDSEQAQFNAALEKAEFELEQLVHAGLPAAPDAPAPDQAPAPEPAPTPEVPDASDPQPEPAPTPNPS